jgi:hypothetical protein
VQAASVNALAYLWQHASTSAGTDAHGAFEVLDLRAATFDQVDVLDAGDSKPIATFEAQQLGMSH